MRGVSHKERKERKGAGELSLAETRRRGGWTIKKAKYLWREVSNLSQTGNERLLSVSQYDGVRPSSEGSRSESLKGYKIVKKGDLVINIMLAWLGGLGVSEYDGIVSPSYAVYRPIVPMLPHYLHYLYRTCAYLAEFARHSTGVVPSRWRMYTDDFGQVLTTLPPLPEQEAIVKYLAEATGKIDKAIEAEEKMVALLQERREIVINEAVGGGCSHAEARRGGVLPKGWKVVPLKRIARLKGGAGFPMQKQGRTSEAIRFIKVNALASHIDPKREYDTISKDEAYAMQAKIFPKGSIVFAKVGAALLLHRFECLPFDSCIDNNMMGLFDIAANPQWLTYALSLLNFNSLVNPGAVPSVNQSQVGMMPIPLPPLPEQEAIVKRLDEETGKIDRAIAVKRRQIELLRERREIIIDAAVRGRVLQGALRAPEPRSGEPSEAPFRAAKGGL